MANDSYLVSQMDADQYVPISTVAGFNQVKRMTTNMELVVEVLRGMSQISSSMLRNMSKTLRRDGPGLPEYIVTDHPGRGRDR